MSFADAKQSGNPFSFKDAFPFLKITIAVTCDISLGYNLQDKLFSAVFDTVFGRLLTRDMKLFFDNMFSIEGFPFRGILYRKAIWN
jgi:hypothetical protein